MIEEIQIEKTGGGVAELVLNRPAKHNAITPAMSTAIHEALKSLELDGEIRCVLVRGAGERAFCAGTDLHTLDDFADAWSWRNAINYALEFNAFRKPLVAAVKGWTFGGGFEIALNCDIRVASKTTKFAAPEVKHGWLGAGGFSQRLTRLVGYGQASRILLTGEPIDAHEAYRIGVVEFLVEDGEELAEGRRLAATIGGHSEIATVTNKAGVRAAMEGGLTNGLAMERELMCLSFALGSQRSGPQAFADRERK